MNKILININSRIYTVVADEDTEYLQRLCAYVNEKVSMAKAEGTHIVGEKPLVLAALNICDEYFKLLDSAGDTKNVSEIMLRNKELLKELEETKAALSEAEEKITEMEGNEALNDGILREAEETIKELKGELFEAEQRTRKQRAEFAIREREFLDLLESK